MFYCPQCGIVITKEAQEKLFCENCGLNLAHPGPNSLFWLRQVQIQSLQLSQLSQLSQTFHLSNSLPELPTLDLKALSKQIPVEIVKGSPYAIDTNKGIDQPIEDEGFIATSAAAEHWRTSWRNRQRSEAGPAATVSRGQSSVPEPLMAMQYSLQRIRAITISQTKKEGTGLGFWITLCFMACIIGILSAYIASTYLPNSSATTHVVSLSASQLMFEAVINQAAPGEQFVKLTNSSSDASIHWTATVFTEHNLDWLSLDESTTSGILHAGGTVIVGINISTMGLRSNVKPYTGHILFTVNQAEQLTLPVELYVQDGIAKIVMSPVSIIGVILEGS